MEIRIFLAVWGATLAHAFWRQPRRAWIEQLATTALLCLGLPLLNWATTGQHLWRYAVNGQHLQAAVEITALAFGLLLLYMACALRRHWSDASDAASTRQAGKPRPDNKGAAHRWQIASRVLAASAGGYLVSAVAMSALALAFPALAGAAPAAGVLTGSLLSFVLYAGIAIGVFAARSARRAWAWLAVAGALSGALLLCLRP